MIDSKKIIFLFLVFFSFLSVPVSSLAKSDIKNTRSLNYGVAGQLVYGNPNCIKNCSQGFKLGSKVIVFTVGPFGNILRADTIDEANDSNSESVENGSELEPNETCDNPRLCMDAPKTKPAIMLVIYMAASPAGPGKVKISTQPRYIVSASNGTFYSRGDIYDTGPTSESITSADNYNGPLDGQFRPANGIEPR